MWVQWPVAVVAASTMSGAEAVHAMDIKPVPAPTPTTPVRRIDSRDERPREQPTPRRHPTPPAADDDTPAGVDTYA